MSPFKLQEPDPSKPTQQQLQIVEARPVLTWDADVNIKRDGEAQVIITVTGFDDAAQAGEFADKINEGEGGYTPPEAEGTSFAPPDTIKVVYHDEPDPNADEDDE
jgi:hypothetical protein